MTTYYLGRTAAGQPVTRKSNRSDYTHAAVPQGWAHGQKLPAFGTSEAGALKNFVGGFGKSATPEVVPVAQVTAKEMQVAVEAVTMTATEALDADIADAREPDQYDAMDRDALCAALAEFEVDCDGMSDDEVRAELRTLAAKAGDEDDFEAEAAAEFANRQRIAAEAEQAKRDEEERIEREHPMVAGKPQAVQVHNTALDKAGNAEGRCPHCGVSTRGGKNVTDYSEMSPGSQNSTTQQFTCNDCAGEWGPVVDKPKKARAPSGSSNGLKIEKDRESRNGVTRPSIGGKCRGIWDMLDGMGLAVTAKEAREAGADKFDRTTIMVQFYRWRKFNGVEGRQA